MHLFGRGIVFLLVFIYSCYCNEETTVANQTTNTTEDIPNLEDTFNWEENQVDSVVNKTEGSRFEKEQEDDDDLYDDEYLCGGEGPENEKFESLCTLAAKLGKKNKTHKEPGIIVQICLIVSFSVLSLICICLICLTQEATLTRQQSLEKLTKTEKKVTSSFEKEDEQEVVSKSKKTQKQSEAELRAKHMEFVKKRMQQEAEDIKSCKFKKIKPIFIPREVTDDAFKLKADLPNIALTKVFYDESLNQQVDIGSDVDDIEMASTSIGSSISRNATKTS